MRRFVQEHDKPDEIHSDNGPEFRGAFDVYLQEEGIAHVVKEPGDHTHMATLERAIGILKSALARRMAAADPPSTDWLDFLQRTVRGENMQVKEVLKWGSPEQVHSKSDKPLQFLLEKQGRRTTSTTRGRSRRASTS